MKLLFLANAGSVHFTRWYEYFIQKGHEVYMASGDTYGLDFKIDLEGLKVFYLPELRLPNKYANFCANWLNLPRIIGRLREIVNEVSPDIVHAHGIHPYGTWGAISGFHPFIVTPIGSDVLIRAQKEYFRRTMTKFVFNNVDLVTGGSLVLKESCEKVGLKTNYELVQNGVDLAEFTMGGGGTIRERYGISASDPVVFYARGFTPLYNVDKIIAAIPLILKKMPECKFILAHHFGNMSGDFQSQIQKLGIADNVIFTGLIQHQDMKQYHLDSDLVISVPKSDNSPSFVYEAMACGVPTLINRIPWTDYAMQHEKNTFIIDEVTPETIAEATLKLLTDETLRDRIIKGGEEAVVNYFCYHKNMEKMEDIYHSLVQSEASVFA